MKEVTKSDVIKATKALVKGYEKNSLDHRTDECPLCLLFYNNELDYSGACSVNCPNMVFKKNYGSHMGCIARQDEFSNLNWRYFDGDERLAMFWTRVGKYLSRQKSEDVLNLSKSERIKAYIVKTAIEIDNMPDIYDK